MPVTKEQQQLAMVGVLVVVLVFVLLNATKPKKKKGALPPAAPVAEVKQPVASAGKSAKSADEKTLSGQKERSDTLGWGRDPFITFEEKVVEGTGFILKGVSIGKGKKGYAFINDEIVRKGDTFMGYEIAEIEKDKVLLTKEGQSFYVVFPTEE